MPKNYHLYFFIVYFLLVLVLVQFRLRQVDGPSNKSKFLYISGLPVENINPRVPLELSKVFISWIRKTSHTS